MAKLALLFPGQGSQEVGMGRDVAEAYPEVMGLWKKAEGFSKAALREIYWDGDEKAMAETRYLQPALTAVNLGLWTVLSRRCSPVATAGHSLGEYSALAAAGVLPFETVLELVSLRGRLMSDADPSGQGGMLALVRMSVDTVRECLVEAAAQPGETLVVANYNTPVQTVVSGSKSALARVQDIVKAKKGMALPLAVSGAFHSPLLQEAAAELAKVISSLPKTAWQDARFPVYSNVTAKAESSAAVLQKQLTSQMTSSVHWVQTITTQYEDGARRFVECGPKNVLTKMVAPILKECPAADVEPAATESVSTLAAADAFS